MKNIFKYITIAAMAVASASCNDFLDVKPVGTLIPTKTSQYEGLLNDYTNTMNYFMVDDYNFCPYAFKGDNVEAGEAHLKGALKPGGGQNNLYACYLFYEQDMDPEGVPVEWSKGLWKPVSIYNNVIDGVEGLKDNSSYGKGVIAQAKVARAWLYLNATFCYGPMWNPAGPNDTPVLPIRTSGDPNVANGPLATTSQLLDFIKSDLDYACENIPENVSNNCRAGKAAAFALRAEYHMYRQEWKEMAADAAKAWEYAVKNAGGVDNMFYNYNNFSYTGTPAKDPNVDPRTTQKITSTELNYKSSLSKENLLYRPGPQMNFYMRWYPSEEFVECFDKTADLRYATFMLKDEAYAARVNGDVVDDGYRFFDVRHDFLCNSIGLTYPMLLLLKAEAEARTGNAAALASLNTFRKYRYAAGTPELTALAGDALVHEVIKDRRREQGLLDFHRVLDLKRYFYDNGKPWRKDKVVHKGIGGKTYEHPLNGPRFNSYQIDNVTRGFNPDWNLPKITALFEPYNAL